MADSSVWFVTGASRGFGAEIVREALRRGDRVVATARDEAAVRAAHPDAGEALLTATVDVTDEGRIAAAVAAAQETFGRIDVLVNNAGHGLLGAVEEVPDGAVRKVFDTNVFGLLAVQRAVLPVMRAQRSGHVVNISSVGGFTTAPGWGLYASTKFAVEGLTEALRMELAPLGIAVTIVEPGGFRTDFLDGSSLLTAPAAIDDYAGTVGTTRDIVDANNHLQVGDPVKAAAAIADLVGTPDPPLRLQLGADCVARIEAKLDAVRAELDHWRPVALSTDLAEAPTT